MSTNTLNKAIRSLGSVHKGKEKQLNQKRLLFTIATVSSRR